MGGLLPSSNIMVNFSFGLLIVMIIALVIFVWMLLAKLNKLKEYITKEKVDIAATIISIVVIAMCMGGVITYLFCMSAFL